MNRLVAMRIPAFESTRGGGIRGQTAQRWSSAKGHGGIGGDRAAPIVLRVRGVALVPFGATKFGLFLALLNCRCCSAAWRPLSLSQTHIDRLRAAPRPERTRAKLCVREIGDNNLINFAGRIRTRPSGRDDPIRAITRKACSRHATPPFSRFSTRAGDCCPFEYRMLGFPRVGWMSSPLGFESRASFARQWLSS